MAKLIRLPGTRPADLGEALVVHHLEAALPNTYTLIPNVEVVQRGRPAFEYDLIVLAPHALYVIEVKRWLGAISGDDYTWTVNGLHHRTNPWPTANNKARVVKSEIESRLPGAFGVWVQAVVAIADDKATLNLRGQCRDLTFRYTELDAYLTEPRQLGSRATDLRPLRGPLEKTLQEIARGRSQRPLQFGSYEVKETLCRRDRVAEYLAANTLLRDPETVRLRVFSYDPYLPAGDLKLRTESIRREAEALQRIGAHPNLITLRNFDVDSRDPNLFVEITEWSDAGTLQDLLAPEVVLTLDRKLELAEGVAAGLTAAHNAGVIHRDVRPENILISQNSQPRLMNFDYARLEKSSALTISAIQRDPDVTRAYLPPELLDITKLATPAADVYGLGVVLFQMLVGDTPFQSPENALEQETAGGGPSDYGVPDVPPRLNELIRQMISPQMTKRPQNMEAVLTELHAIRQKPSGTLVEEPPEQAAPFAQPVVEPEPDLFPVGSLIDDKYLVQAIMPDGASGQVYKVYDNIFDTVYALKLFKNRTLSQDALRREVQPILNISHPNIVKIQSWGRLPQGRPYLVSEFIDGEELTKYVKPQNRLPARQAIQIIIDLLSALEALHPNIDQITALLEKKNNGEIAQEEWDRLVELQSEGFLHRDIKPANLMLSKDGHIKLVDFNIARKANEANITFVGTLGYMLPDTGIMRWNTDADLFATGIVLYELITGRHPYPDRQPNAETQPADPREFVPELAPKLAKILENAVSVLPQARYHSAARFSKDLIGLDGLYIIAPSVAAISLRIDLTDEEVGKANYNPYVTRLLRLYSQAQRDNGGTRGLDQFARLTYIDTRLDKFLGPAVLDAQYHLVIITGNAGDGKTAFIQNLEQRVEKSGAVIEHPTPNSSHFTHLGTEYFANYDGSQDEGAERANDQVLSEFFLPFADASLIQPVGSSTGRSVHLIAINEGRLVDFFHTAIVGQGSETHAFSQVGRLILEYFTSDAPPALPPWLLIVDLNRRSVIATDPDEDDQSILDRQLQALLKQDLWAPCQSCALRAKCFIKFNADTLADPISGGVARERLRRLFEIVHLRRKLHITMRDLRSALSWLILRDHNCDDIAVLLSHPMRPQTILPLLYANAFASDGQPPASRTDDRLVRLLRQIDPAEVANPADDRVLYFHGLSTLPMAAFEQRSNELLNLLDEWQLPTGWDIASDPDAINLHRARQFVARRFAFFERRDDLWEAMLPYRELSRFDGVMASKEQALVIRDLIVEAISLAEGAQNDVLARKHICLRAGGLESTTNPTGITIKSFRLFAASDFSVEIPRQQGIKYLEYTPDRILFFHSPLDPTQPPINAKRAELVVSLDLLELLAQIRAGFKPSPDDVSGYFINLVTFKNALLHLPYRAALLTRDDRTYYELTQVETANVELRQWEAV